MKKWFQDELGNESFMRIAGMVALILGVCVCIAGVAGFFFQLKDSLLVLAVGGVDIVGVVVAKAWQKGSEKGGE